MKNNNNFDIPENIRNEWQSIVDLIARITKVRAALIMRVKNEKIEVFLSSKTAANPYHPGNREPLIDSGLYCEQVIRSRKMLMVPNAEKIEEWQHNPDMKYQMKCYLGFPIHLPDGGIFGTICMLDDKQNDFSEDTRAFMEKMRDLIESYLYLLHLSITDRLTGLYNRTYLDLMLNREIQDADTLHKRTSALLLDIDRFKEINDTFGHLSGDSVLKKFADVLNSFLPDSAMAFRFGGDEFFILMPNTPIEAAVCEAEKLRVAVKGSLIWPNMTVSIGAAERMPSESVDDWFSRVDKALYGVKRTCRNQVGV